MCLQPGVERLGGKEFSDYCKSMREDSLCEYYMRLKSGEQLSTESRSVIVQLGKTAPNSPEQVRMTCSDPEYRVCPYEITIAMAKDARVIITDYSYIFNEGIRDSFLKRLNRELADCILIIDEGHNLPERVKDLATQQLTTFSLRRAINELQRAKNEDHRHHLQEIGELLVKLRDEFLTAIKNICPPEQLIDALEEIAGTIREEQKSSSCGAVADFLSAWAGEDEGFTRILSREKGRTEPEEQEQQQTIFGKKIEMPSPSKQLPPLGLRYRCLDPSIITKPVFDAAYSTIIVSGTLTPVQMYAQLLGMTDPIAHTLLSPFPADNRLNLLIPKTTTKFTTRSTQMFDEMSKICTSVVMATPGNCAIFFPSYAILEEVKRTFETSCPRTVFTEHPSYTKEEREDLLGRFKQYKHTGAVLLGVMGGSFSEGIDLPGDELRTVVIVGLPLSRPDLETKALIDYYQKKFGRGWDYGYTFPAFNKTLQSAGRCIRTETDRGVIVFLDERYAWESYYACFPKDWHMKMSFKYEELIKQFFR
jgi:DNA excision repair protein ERCC-2